jgi:hypothetical protein
MAYGNLNVDTVTTSTSGGVLGAGNASIMKNRCINGDMRIDQRNAGASVTSASGTSYTLDRWATSNSQASKYSVQQIATTGNALAAGFSYALGITSLSAYSLGAGDYFNIQQRIEGFNTADLQFGTASAKTVTLSFWVSSSLTGTFGGVLQNSTTNYCYPFTYTISSANTYEYKTVTITGATAGTWVGATNGRGLFVSFGLGVGSTYSGTAGSWASASYESATGATSVVGTNGATFYITGVQLEVGSSATGFEYRQYGQELALCQRYFEKSYDISTAPATVTGNGECDSCISSAGGGNLLQTIKFSVSKRASGATITGYNSSTGATGTWLTTNNAGIETTNAITFDLVGTNSFRLYTNTGVALTVGRQHGHWTASSEL